jgi:gas vesicle protein
MNSHDNEYKLSEGRQFLYFNYISFFFLIFLGNDLRLAHESQIPSVPYINSFVGNILFFELSLKLFYRCVGMASGNVAGTLLQNTNLNPFPQPRMGPLYGNSSFSVDDAMSGGNHLSAMMPQQLLHLQSYPSGEDMSRPSISMIEASSSLPHAQPMLLSQTMFPHSQRSDDGDSQRFSQNLVPGASSNGQQNRWAGLSRERFSSSPHLPVLGSSSKKWHSEAHSEAKKEMNRQIIELLQLRRPNATPDWRQKLPQMAKRLEEALYSEANSFHEYTDRSTLKGRLQQLASSMGNRIQNRPSSNNNPNQPPQALLHRQMQPSNQMQHENTGQSLTQSSSMPMRLGNTSTPNMNGQVMRSNSTGLSPPPFSH